MRRACVDLSITMNEDTLTNQPVHFPLSLVTYLEIEKSGWRATEIKPDSHPGASIVSPAGRDAAGSTVHLIDFECVNGGCQVLHTSSDEIKTAVVIEQCRITQSMVLFRRGWSDCLDIDCTGYFGNHARLTASTAPPVVNSWVRIVGDDESLVRTDVVIEDSEP